MDPQGQQPTDAQPVAQDDAAPSVPPQETESGFMNRLIRGVRGVLGQDDESSERDAEQPSAAEQPTPDAAEPPPEPAQPEQITLSRAEFERAVQSRSDALLARQQRDWAKARADEGDLAPIRTLAEKGDPWAQRQLAENGDTWALGEIKQRELREQQARENDPLPILAKQFDQALLHPLLGALPKEDEERIVGQGLAGYEGRTRAVTEAIGLIKKQAAAEALTKALDDPEFVRKAIGESSALRQALITHPVFSKQLWAAHRGLLEEPDLAPGLGPGRGGTRENDVMNAAIRDAWQGAEARAPDERAAMAGATNGRLTHRDVLDDDA